jgi:hypothetical protein
MNILCALPDTNDCISWWRAWMPLMHMQRADPTIQVDLFNFMENRSIGWHTIEKADVVYMSRPFLRDYMTVIGMAKKLGKKVWVDYDDNYWQVPHWNHCKQSFGEQACAYLDVAAQLADVVTVSTPVLADMLRTKTDKPIHVVPNAFPDRYVWPTAPRKKVVLYRGGWKTHAVDLKSVASQFQAVIDAHPDWTFMCATQGHPIMVDGPNVQFVGDISLPDFHLWAQELAPAIMVNPLEFSDFNRAKSNIAWMEGTLAGAAVLCPSMPQYMQPGCVTYEFEDQFGDQLRAMLSADPEHLQTRAKEGQDAIDAKYRVSIVNKQRAAILKDLLSPTPTIASPRETHTANPGPALQAVGR